MKKLAVAGLSILAAAATAVPAKADSVSVEVQGQRQGKFPGDTGPKKGMVVYHLEVGGISPLDMATGRPTGRRQWSPVKFTKALDKASPLFFQAMAQNETLTTVTFTVHGATRMPDGRVGAGLEAPLYTITLTNASVVSDKVIAPADKDPAASVPLPSAIEEVSLTFQKIQVTYVPGGTSGMDDWGVTR